MALLLFLEAFLELLDQLVQAAEGLDLRLFLVGQQALELLAQPFLGDQRLEVVVELLQALEVGAEGPVELVEVALVLDHDGARQVVELVHVGEHHAVLQGIDQVEQLAHRHRHLGCAHFVEQVEQHGCDLVCCPLIPARERRSVLVFLRQVVGDDVPVGFRTHVDVPLRYRWQRRVEGAEGDRGVRRVLVAAKPLQVRSAVAAEGTGDAWRRVVFGHRVRPGDIAERLAAHLAVGGERRAVGLAALAAMTMAGRFDGRVDLVTYRAAQATSAEHGIFLRCLACRPAALSPERADALSGWRGGS
jgi:hypothetical protein